MRRTDHLTNTERALTLALVLVAAGYAPGAISVRGLVLPRSASTDTTIARNATSRSAEAREASHEETRRPDRSAPQPIAEQPVRHVVVPAAAPIVAGATRVAPARAVFLAPPSQRGPPALG